MFAEVVTACAGGAVLTGWALYLHASALIVGLLGALTFAGQLVQLPAAWVSATFGHRKACIVTVAASRQALLPLVALPFLPLEEGSKQLLLVAVAAVSALLAVAGNNAWVSWMGDLVPHTLRGRYFGRRTALTTLGNTVAMSRKSYVHPVVVMKYLRSGTTIALPRHLAHGNGAGHAPEEEALICFLDEYFPERRKEPRRE